MSTLRIRIIGSAGLKQNSLKPVDLRIGMIVRVHSYQNELISLEKITSIVIGKDKAYCEVDTEVLEWYDPDADCTPKPNFELSPSMYTPKAYIAYNYYWKNWLES